MASPEPRCPRPHEGSETTSTPPRQPTPKFLPRNTAEISDRPNTKTLDHQAPNRVTTGQGRHRPRGKDEKGRRAARSQDVDKPGQRAQEGEGLGPNALKEEFAAAGIKTEEPAAAEAAQQFSKWMGYIKQNKGQ